MSYELTDFLVSLSEPEGFKRFATDAEMAMERAGLNAFQKQAVRTGDQYRIRRLTAMEMFDDSVHARLIMKNFQEYDPDFKLSGSVDGNGSDPVNEEANDVTAEEDHNIVQNEDLGDDIADFSPRYSVAHYYDDLFSKHPRNGVSNEVVFVGSGIDGANHLTPEALGCIAAADKVLYCVADVVVERRIQKTNRNWDDLYRLYGDEKPRRQTYEEMVDEILQALEQHRRVCAVFYGHPGIFVWPSYRTIQIARSKGYHARMLPAVSSLDCLYADVGFDPSRYSCQIIEATDLLVRSRKLDTDASVVIFQVGCVGDLGFNSRGYDQRNVPVLAEYLATFYGADYNVILYEAAQYPVCDPIIRRVTIGELPDTHISGIATLYIPPKGVPRLDEPMVDRLGLRAPQFTEESSKVGT